MSQNLRGFNEDKEEEIILRMVQAGAAQLVGGVLARNLANRR